MRGHTRLRPGTAGPARMPRAPCIALRATQGGLAGAVRPRVPRFVIPILWHSEIMAP